MSKILITGGTGLIGTALIPKLIEKGHHINVLSRSKKESDNKHVSYFTWDIKNQTIEEEALNGVDYIIHLAGAGIADSNWTTSRKKELINSRVDSLRLLYNAIEKLDHKPKKLLSTSGIGYYGAITTDKTFKEEDDPAKDFVAEICIKWEEAASEFLALGINVFIPRVGVVLSPEGGALERMKKPTKYNFGAALGSGKQYMPWIHLDDICELYIFAIENEKVAGVYNAVADEHVTNKSFSALLAKVMNKSFFLPNVPRFMLNMMFGEMANIILEGSRVSNDKIKATGFNFRFNNIKKALEDVVN